MERPDQITPTQSSTPSTGDEATRPADSRDPASPAGLDLRRPAGLRAHWLFMGLACLIAAGGFVAGLVSLVGFEAVAWPALALLAVALVGGLLLPTLARAVTASLERRGLLATGWRAGLRRRLRPFTWLLRAAACVTLAGLLAGIGARAHVASLVDDYLAEVERLDKRGPLLSTEKGGDARQHVLALGAQAVPWLIRADLLQSRKNGTRSAQGGAIRRVFLEIGLPAVPALDEASRGTGRYFETIWDIMLRSYNVAATRGPSEFAEWAEQMEAFAPHLAPAFIDQVVKKDWAVATRGLVDPKMERALEHFLVPIYPCVAPSLPELLAARTARERDVARYYYKKLLEVAAADLMFHDKLARSERAATVLESLGRQGPVDDAIRYLATAARAEKVGPESRQWDALKQLKHGPLRAISLGKSAYARTDALKGLKRLGPLAKPARETLILLSKEGRTGTERDLAAEALAAIGD